MDSDRHHSRFRNRDRIHDSEICVHPSPSRLRMDIPDLHATTQDALAPRWRVERKRPRGSPPLYWLRATARAAAVEALVAGSVANHDRAAVRAGRCVLLAHETDLDRARIDRFPLDRRWRRGCRRLDLDDRLAAHDADGILLDSADELRGQPAGAVG